MADPEGQNQLFPEDSGWTYGQILPLKRGPQGQLAPAWPGMVHDFVNDANDLALAPQRAYKGQLSQDDMMALGPKMAQVGMMESPMGLEMDLGKSAIFAGVMAKTANKAKLAVAQGMEASGEHAEDIWNKTGWFRGPEGKWRFEIPDTKAAIRAPYRPDSPGASVDWGQGPGGLSTVSDVMYHPELQKAYPQLGWGVNVANLPAADADKMIGAYDPALKQIFLHQTRGDPLSTLLHETQHGVQHIEGFAEGGSADQFLPPGFDQQYREGLENFKGVMDEIRAKGVDPNHVAKGFTAMATNRPISPETAQHVEKLAGLDLGLFDKFLDAATNMRSLSVEKARAEAKYNSLAGEVEARNVQERHAQGDTYTFPLNTPGYPIESQIVRVGGKNLSATPVDHDPFIQVEPVEHDPFKHSITPIDHDPFQTEAVAP